MHMHKNYRNELKYYINHIDHIKLLDRMKGIFVEDTHSKDRGYLVRSLYFDNKSNNSYYHKIAGVSDRQKYRIRIYDLNPSPIKLEIKSKRQTYIHKQSVTIAQDQARRLIEGDYRFLAQHDHRTARLVLAKFSQDSFHPAVIIDYFRQAYVYPESGLRVTFDRCLGKNETSFSHFFQSGLDLNPVIDSKRIIMEIKFSQPIPLWIKKILQVGSFESCAISKYTLSRYIEG